MEQRRALIRASQIQEQREAARKRLGYKRDIVELIVQMNRGRRNGSTIDLNQAALLYDCTIDCSLHRLVCIDPIDVVCQHCRALKFAGVMLEMFWWCNDFII